jgi:hypothetical protein
MSVNMSSVMFLGIIMMSVVMPSVIMLSVIFLSVIMLSVIFLNVIMLSVVMPWNIMQNVRIMSNVVQSAVMLTAIIPNVVAPTKYIFSYKCIKIQKSLKSKNEKSSYFHPFWVHIRKKLLKNFLSYESLFKITICCRLIDCRDRDIHTEHTCTAEALHALDYFTCI